MKTAPYEDARVPPIIRVVPQAPRAPHYWRRRHGVRESRSMTMTHTEAVLRQIDPLFGAGTFAGLPDAELLGRFLSQPRRGGLRGSGRAAWADGVQDLPGCAQGLAQERRGCVPGGFPEILSCARAHRSAVRLEGWLHRSAVRVAVQANTAVSNRRAKEHHAGELSLTRPPATVDNICAASAHRDERLPGPLRLPLVLCHLKGLTRAEAARRLRWSEGTVRDGWRGGGGSCGRG